MREYPSSLQLSLYLWVLLENRIVPLCWESLLVYVRGSLDQLCSPGEWTALLTDPFKSNMADGEVKVGQEKLSSMLHAGKHTDTAHLSPQLFLICRLCQRWAHWFFSLCLCALSANIVSYKSTAVKRSSSLLLERKITFYIPLCGSLRDSPLDSSQEGWCASTLTKAYTQAAPSV